ncbi:MAG: polymerase LigD, ligase domain protein, partial [Acidimicrobiaceae bacterium]|nr:polymerase LigD, ligase domain protein [Acidimicrobiaceae bacterium]
MAQVGRQEKTTSPLKDYRAKRDPAKTPEPMGRTHKGARQSTAPTFVIQEHHARALHWDFRLEHEGVLVSWALPKGLPLDPRSNHLAVHTEDHPLDYGSFEGEIPQGEYGGGKVIIWDRGTYQTEKWTEREVKVVLHGKRATGRYVLFPTGGKNWMIHRMDPPPPGFEPVPDKISPMLAESGQLPNKDEGWAYEFKWDGVRAIAFVDGGRVRALSRNDKDLTASFPELRGLGEHLGSRAAVLDGEIVALDPSGRPSFGRLQQRLHLGSASEVARRARDFPANYFAFDLLYLEGRSLLSEPYDERRQLLEGLELSGDSFVTPPTFRDRPGADVLAAAREGGLEGIVAKRKDSPYRPGQRSGEWIKVKNFRTQEVVIGGWTEGKGGRSGSLGALLLGLPGPEGLQYVGKVWTGFDEATRRQ